MDNFVLILIEGKDIETIKANFVFTFRGLLKDNFEFEVKNSIIYIKDKDNGEKVAELNSVIYDLSNYYMLLISIPIDFAEKILNEDFYTKIKDGSIYVVPPLKLISFVFKRDTLAETLNSFALNTIKFYRDKYESQNKKLVLDEFPLIISYEKEYEIPTAIYKEMHTFENYITRFANKI